MSAAFFGLMHQGEMPVMEIAHGGDKSDSRLRSDCVEMVSKGLIIGDDDHAGP